MAKTTRKGAIALTLGSPEAYVISEKRDFDGNLVLASSDEESMQERGLTFGRFRLDPRAGTDGWHARSTPDSESDSSLLSFLAARPGEVVTKDELFGAVWPETTVGDAALVTCIQELRKALRDDARRPRYIETLHRRGYRFIAKAAPSTASDAKRGSLPLPDRPSIAVLPFANMSGDPHQENFADGISDNLITGLAHIRWLFVIARNSSFVYKQRAVNVSEVARTLGVRYVLEGSVRRAGTRLRITAQLVDAVSGGHHWAERYDREIGDIFAVQDELTRSVAGAIEPHLLAAEGVRALARSDDLGAWEMVSQAQTHFWRLTRADCATARPTLEQAVATHPRLRGGPGPAWLLPGLYGPYGLDRA